MNRIIRLALDCCLVAVFLSCALSTSAQVATGTPPFGSYGGGPDTINLANLNAHIDVPVFGKAGRGMAFTYDLVYDSSVWTPVTVGTTTTWQPTTNWGWGASTQTQTGYFNVNIEVTDCGFYKNNIWINEGYIYYYSPWIYVDKYGASHPFSGETIQYAGRNGYCPGQNTSLNAVATDGSGYTIQATGGSATIVARNGTISVPPINSGSGSGTSTDRNGNQISVNSSGVFTDTLGTAALTVAGTAPSPTTFTYTAPSGANALYTMKYSTYTIQTNFGCSNIGEYSASNVPLVSEIDLPDGTKYLFAYETTYQHSPNVTGRLASVTLPTGGAISYTYGTGGVNGITCADGSASTLNRATPDGTWAYVHSESGTAWTTLITDPQNNQTNMNFQGIYKTQSQVYQGSVSSGTLLKTTTVCYNGNTTNCNSTAISLPISRRTIVVQWPGANGQQSKTDIFYNSYGLTTERDRYAYGPGAPGSLLKKTRTAYASLGNNIVDRPSTVTVYDGSSNVKSQVTYTYDQGSVTTTSGTPQHTSITGSRGNLTTASYLVQGSTTLSKTYTYFDTGNVQTGTDVNSAVTTYTYGSGTSCGNSFVTSVSEPLSLSRSMAWNCTGGVETSLTDENSQPTSYTYSNPDFWRLDSLQDAASDVVNFTYTGATSVESALLFNGNASTVDVLTTRDGLGRTHISQIKEAPSSSTYDSTETDFDSDGRADRATLPYAGTAGQTSSSAPGKSTVYDALGRKTQTTDSGGRSVTFGYSQNDTYLTLGPAPTGEHTKQKQFEYDSLGRLTSVCEVTALTGSGTCGQTTAATGYWTKYTYDAIGDLTGVTQNAQSSSTQSRTYAYDDLGRMTSESNPESGTTSYTYDTDSSCGTSKGDLVKKVDAVGDTTCYAYDALHRTTSITYSGPYSSSTPNKYFVYDAATVNGVAMSDVKARMAEAYTATCSTCTKITDIGLGYSVLGQPSDIYESTPHSLGYYHTAATYWANGMIHQLTGPSYSLSYNVDGEGRVYSTSASGQNPLTSTSYNVASQPTQVNFGSSDSDSFTYDPNTDRMTQYKFTVNGQSVVGNLTWNANASLGSLGITDPFYTSGNQSCSYSHDDLSRIASANCGSAWSQTFTFDAFGNINKSGTSSFQPTYSYVTNHMTQIGSSTPTYDANGNVTNDFLHTYAWDAAGRPVTVDGVGISYDALGRMVEQNRSGAYTELVYSPTGFKLLIMNGQTVQKSFAPLPGNAMALYTSSAMYYLHSDWLGTSRFASTTTRTMYFDAAYGPFGEPYAESGNPYLSYTGMNQDIVSNLYDFPAREYGIQGRWPSPDPAGLTAVRFRDPQTWNRYSYVRNSPLSRVDPTGMCDTADPDSPVDAAHTSHKYHAECGDGIMPDPGGAIIDPGLPALPDPTPAPDPGNPPTVDPPAPTEPTVEEPPLPSPDPNLPGNSVCPGFDGDPNVYNCTIAGGVQQPAAPCDTPPCISSSAQQIFGQAGQMSAPVTQPYFVPCFFAASAVAGFSGGVALGGEALAATAPLAPYLPVAMQWAYNTQGKAVGPVAQVAGTVANACTGN